MFAPLISGSNNDAMAETAFTVVGGEAFTGSGKEGVDIGLLEGMGRLVELALNGPIIAGTPFPGNQVNPDIGIPPMRPFGP